MEYDHRRDDRYFANNFSAFHLFFTVTWTLELTELPDVSCTTAQCV